VGGGERWSAKGDGFGENGRIFQDGTWLQMSMISYASREINCKVVYYGTGLGGKTTNLEHVYSRVNPETRGKMISLATETDRTLFFDFLPIDLGSIRGFKTRFHLYTVPGQVYYNASRKLILKNVDGIIFVADSQGHRQEANLEAMHNLYENLETYGYDLSTIPFVIQYNKRDLADAVPVETLRAQLNPGGVPDFEGVATDGAGVFETLRSVSKLVVKTLS
jgi:signal recognition particle receptor subunit beta